MSDEASTAPENGTSTSRWVLKDLAVIPRSVIAVFLISVGIGYFSALVQLHFQHAKAGELVPSPQDAAHAYHGNGKMSILERLIVADENLPFNGAGTMKPAFTTKSSAWRRAKRVKAKAMMLDPTNDADLRKAEQVLRKEREWEIKAVLSWIHSGAKEDDYGEHILPDDLAKEIKDAMYESEFFYDNDDGKLIGSIINIIDVRCVRCHPGSGGPAGQIYLDEFETLKLDYLQPEDGSGMPLRKLAQSTHVHLLGFSMLYGLTGLIFCFTSYPGFIRLILAPFTLIMQIIDISCWWLARLPGDTGAMFGQAIALTGALVGGSLGAQILLTLLDLFKIKGKLIMLLVIIAGAAGFAILYMQVIQPFIANESMSAGGP